MLQDLEVDAVFLDIQMPGLTGLDLAQVLSRFRTPPPIVFVTAHDDVKVAMSPRADGECLRKPFDDDHLLGAIARACTKVQ